MAVDQPFPGPARGPDHVIPLPGSHIDGVGEEASRRRKRLTVSHDNLEWASVDMHRMNERIVRADKAHFQGLIQGHMDRIRRGITDYKRMTPMEFISKWKASELSEGGRDE
jgi:hypothetical protein